jgi:UDP-N-acetyl-D-mannosaminuronate dehydrogenase
VDAVAIITDHSDLDYARIYHLSSILVDARNVTAGLPESHRTSHPQRWIVKGGVARETPAAVG